MVVLLQHLHLQHLPPHFPLVWGPETNTTTSRRLRPHPHPSLSPLQDMPLLSSSPLCKESFLVLKCHHQHFFWIADNLTIWIARAHALKTCKIILILSPSSFKMTF